MAERAIALQLGEDESIDRIELNHFFHASRYFRMIAIISTLDPQNLK